MTKKSEKISEKISDYRPQSRNANKHNQRGMGLLQKSIETDGFIGAMTAADDGEIIAGSARLEKSAEVFGVEAEPIVIETDGTRPIIVKRTDIDSADDPRAKRLSIADNRVQEVDLEWDTDVLEELDVDLGDWWFDEELSEMDYKNPKLKEEKTEIRQREMFRVLISVPVDQALEVKEIIEHIADVDGVEIDYGSN